MQDTMTLDEANRRVEEYIRQALTALPRSAQLELQEKYEDLDCDDPTDSGPAGRRFASRSYQVTGLNAAEIPTYYNDLKAWWPQHGFKILKDDSRPTREYLWVEKGSDSFRMAFEANDLGQMYLIASSPCVWREGTPSPQ